MEKKEETKLFTYEPKEDDRLKIFQIMDQISFNLSMSQRIHLFCVLKDYLIKVDGVLIDKIQVIKK